MQGDSNNGPAVVPFNADSSLLYRVLLRDSVIVPNEPICCRMPKNADPLTGDQQAIIYNWINEGAMGPTVAVEDESLDESSSLHVFPNPFNNKVKISYSVNEPGLTYILIFDILGKKIKTISRKNQSNAIQSCFWNGTDDFDRPVSGGLYLIGIKRSNRLERLEKVLYIK